MKYERAQASRPGLAPPAAPWPRWTIAGPEEAAELCVDTRRGATPLVKVRGEIDIASGPWLREELLRVIRRHGARLVVDLSGVTFMDCAGINVLLMTRRRARLEGGWLHVSRASPRARRIIMLAGLQQAFALPAQMI